MWCNSSNLFKTHAHATVQDARGTQATAQSTPASIQVTPTPGEDDQATVQSTLQESRLNTTENRDVSLDTLVESKAKGEGVKKEDQQQVNTSQETEKENERLPSDNQESLFLWKK